MKGLLRSPLLGWLATGWFCYVAYIDNNIYMAFCGGFLLVLAINETVDWFAERGEQ